MKRNTVNGHNTIPAQFLPRKIRIIGGEGSMGQRLADEFDKDGYEVRVTGEESINRLGVVRSKELTRYVRRWNESVCKSADVVVLSVPIPVLAGGNGLAQIFGHTPHCGWRDKLVIDVCSTKVQPLQALSQLRGASIIGTHPMFGPKVKSLAGQTVFLCPVPPPNGNKVLQARFEVRKQWLEAFWIRRGVSVVEIGAEQHDALMPSVQFGVFVSVLLYGEGLKQSGIPLERLQQIGTPNSRALCARLARMLSPAMLSTYANLTLENSNNLKWLNTALDTLNQLKRWMVAADRQSMLAWMQQLAGSQPTAFRDHFAGSSIFLDECLANREFITHCLANEDQIQSVLDNLTAGVKTLPQSSAA